MRRHVPDGPTSMVLVLLMVFFGVRSYRDQVAGGSLSFGRDRGADGPRRGLAGRRVHHDLQFAPLTIPETAMQKITPFLGPQFIAFNGGPQMTFTPAVSLYVNCESQAEVDIAALERAAAGESR